MSEPVLELSEHELYFLPPGTSAIAPATRVKVEVDGELRAFLARLIWDGISHKSSEFYSVFFRIEDSPTDNVFGHQTSVKKAKESFTEQETIGQIIKSIGSERVSRHWIAPDVSYGLRIAEMGRATVLWETRNKFGENLVSFRCGAPWRDGEFFYFARRDFFSFCSRMHENEDSDLHRALRWGELPAEQRDEIAFRCENGDWPALHRLFSLVLIVLTCQYRILPDSPSERISWRFDRELDFHRLFEAFGAVARAQCWQSAICDITRPAFWPDEPSFITNWRHNRSYYPNIYTARCGTPTHHEVLEAQLELRDFLRPHLPQFEIEALFAPE